MEMDPIGWVESPVEEAVDRGWGDVESLIRLKPELTPGLRGLECFSHLIVVFWLHRAGFDPRRHLVRRPQGREDMPEIGILAQRARHRPNPLGVTAVELVEVGGNGLRVRGLDAIDGTPVVDIKPYFPIYDRVDDARVPDWVDRLMADYF